MLVLLLVTSSNCQVPEENKSNDFSHFNAGFGFGLDYGGFGVRASYLPIKYVAIFGSAGYNLLELGYNFGVTGRLLPGKQFCPTLSMMYSYNGVIKISGASQYNKTYFGPSVSGGVEWHGFKNANHFFNLELVVPFRPDAFTSDYNNLKTYPGLTFQSSPLPIAFSIGYHVGF